MYIIKIDNDIPERLGEEGARLYERFHRKEYNELTELIKDLEPNLGVRKAAGMTFTFTSLDDFNFSDLWLYYRNEPIGDIEETT
ncbi:MAG: hypothetical protein GXO64_01985 [Candidatus Micrarchaeota archaeon]|nr:hypothetical protein [Candidatus Micrarchaeota archaeon]